MPESIPDRGQVNQVAVPAIPTLNRPVTTMRHPVDWGASFDLDELVGQRAMALAKYLATGCWYLNPQYTVRSLNPAAEFFAGVRKAQSSWIQSTRDIMEDSGRRQEVRKAVQKGRRAAFLGLTPAPSAGQSPDPPTSPIPLGSLSSDQRREVIKAGQLAKQLAFGGVLFINGELIEPPTWNRLADELLTQVKVITRSVDLSALKASSDTAALEDHSLSGIRDHLAIAPEHVAFVTPLKTISAPILGKSFLNKATRHQREWFRMLGRQMGDSQLRSVRLSSDTRALTLAFHGVLVRDGRLFRPDFDSSPGQSPDPGSPDPFPGHLTLVSGQELGLTVPVRIDGPDHPHLDSRSPGTDADVPSALNDYFLTLFDGDGP
jgi:hypothetical protein